ncbi:hypothetical protein [Gemmata sp.]|uniref:hypothetical protein n=1 Tax=Gemmata sp. TaxID=1914242 RepID=UPI003F6EF470
MSRFLLAAGLLAALPQLAPAQSGMEGGFRRKPPAAPAPAPTPPPRPPRGGIGGGFCADSDEYTPRLGYPYSGIWAGHERGYPYPYGGGFGYAPATSFAPNFSVVDPAPEPIAPGRNLALEEFPAVLVVEFPAPAEVWINGNKVAGQRNTQWTLTSPAIRVFSTYTFDVKGRWTANGKTYEYTRSIDVTAGSRGRALVVAGAELKE